MAILAAKNDSYYFYINTEIQEYIISIKIYIQIYITLHSPFFSCRDFDRGIDDTGVWSLFIAFLKLSSELRLCSLPLFCLGSELYVSLRRTTRGCLCSGSASAPRARL